MLYEVDFAPGVLSAIRGLSAPNRRAIGYALHGLQQNPRREGVEKMSGYENQYRLRPAGAPDYRIVFSIYDKRLVIEVLAVDDRKQVYKKLKRRR